MASSAKPIASLPVINITPWIESDQKGRLSTAAALHAACLDYGFFYLDISSVADPSEPKELARLAREFFALPQDQKDAISLAHQDRARGYQRLKENITNGLADNHEAIDFYRPVETPDKSRPLWGENQWPDVPNFRVKYEAWIAKMKRLGMAVMEAMATGLGMTSDEWEILRAQVDDSFWVMRIIGYPPLPNDQAGFSCGAHKDYGCLTFLWADPTKSALQVFLPQPDATSSSNSDGTQNGIEQGIWINADPIPGCVVCNIGEMWEIWTNGLYKSTLHRVIHRGSNYRVSIPFFFEPNFDAMITPLSAALRLQNGVRKPGDDSEPTKKYTPTRYGDFLMKKVGGNFATGKGRYADD
ncbi:Clavaminate synthase-like protein [Vararia minispora EC-137]|uniref:Clavaminate synthase-like protein n=1 Tax=Vararia minispora EC-137 TaxID=1314806 RepID=A0ACB8QSD9_9AGAM|nr:Clavaminate synthase-like protein [Vararia minispora EC-137]